MVETKTSYKCSACGMIKTIPADQKAPTCCGKVMQKTAPQKPEDSKEGSCCSGSAASSRCGRDDIAEHRQANGEVRWRSYLG